jgi:hypothetical protein
VSIVKRRRSMLMKSKFKWIGTIVLAGFLLVSALLGGKWGTSYAADAAVSAPPVIYKIIPDAIPAGSPDKPIVISGANFGDVTDTAVRIKGTVVDQILIPVQVIPDGLSLWIPAALLVNVDTYLVTVVKSTQQSIPTIPITPWDEQSNALPLTVYAPKYQFLPMVSK